MFFFLGDISSTSPLGRYWAAMSCPSAVLRQGLPSGVFGSTVGPSPSALGQLYLAK